jgi:four helix bundle protein
MRKVMSYRDLEAWQFGMDVVEHVYALTRLLPREELYGLSAQLRRAAISIPSNVAAGQQQGASKPYVRSLSIALGSEAELQTQLELVIRLHLAPKTTVDPVMQLASRTGRILRGLRASIRRRAKQERAGEP